MAEKTKAFECTQGLSRLGSEQEAIEYMYHLGGTVIEVEIPKHFRQKVVFKFPDESKISYFPSTASLHHAWHVCFS